MSEQAEDELPCVDEGVYERGAEVARGGLGRIVMARDTRLDRMVALKELAVLHPDARARFAREVLLTARLQHPSIIPVHEAGRWPSGLPFYAMKLVEGRSLADVIEDAPDFTARLALLPHVADIADAIAYAHDQHVIHRDLKPANVLVGPFGETVVIDWGLAKDLDAPDSDAPERRGPSTGGGMNTSDGAVLGTPAYMPPEQAAGSVVDERADVYALGAILYQVLAGVRPYAHVVPREVVTAVIEGPPRPLVELAPDAPRDLIAIATKAMARDPDARYRTAQELADELKRFATGSLVAAHQYSPWELLRRFGRKARGVLVTAAVAVTVLAVLGVMSVRRIARERDRAADNARTAVDSQRAEATARAEAEARVDELVLARARALLDSDPTMSIAWLATLRQMPPGAVSIAEEARQRGVAQRVLEAHRDAIWDVVVTRDAVVTAGSDGMLVWTPGGTAHRALAGHTDRVQTLTLAPDGVTVASGGYDRVVRVWDVAAGTSRAFAGHADRVKQVAFAGAAHVVSLDASGGLRLAELATGTSRALPIEARADGVLAVSGDQVAVSARGFEIALAELGTNPARALRGHRAPVTALAFDPERRQLASGSGDGEVWLWDVASGGGRRLGASGTAIRAVAWRGSAFATGDASGALMRWTGDDHRAIGQHGDAVTSLAFAGDDLLVSTSDDRSARIWRPSTGDVRALIGHRDSVTAAALAPGGAELVTVSLDRTARVWPLEAPSPLTIGRHQHGVRSVDVSPDGRLVASAGRDHAVGVWGLDGGGGRLLGGHRDLVYRVRFSGDGTRVVSSSDDRSVRVWSLATGTAQVLDGHGGDVEELALSPDRRFVASASKDDTARLWTLGDGTGRVLTRHDGDVAALAWAPDSSAVASAGRDGLVRIAAIASTEDARLLEGGDGDVWDVAYGGGGAWLAAVSGAGALRVWDITTGAQRGETIAVPGARLVRVDGERIAVAGRGTTIWLCTRNEVSCRALRGHTGAIEDLALENDLLVSAGADGLVLEWDLATGEHVALRGHAGTVYDVELAPDHVVSAGGDGAVIRWPRVRLTNPQDLRQLLGELTQVRVGGD